MLYARIKIVIPEYLEQCIKKLKLFIDNKQIIYCNTIRFCILI